MICPYCENEIRDNATFCTQCGKKIDRNLIYDLSKSTPELQSEERRSYHRRRDEVNRVKAIIIITLAILLTITTVLVLKFMIYDQFFLLDDGMTILPIHFKQPISMPAPQIVKNL